MLVFLIIYSMKELIKYYYNIEVLEFRAIDVDVYVLKSQSNNFIFKKTQRTKEQLEIIEANCNYYAYERNRIIRNRFGELFTINNENNYVMVILNRVKKNVPKELQFIPVREISVIPEIWENKVLLIEKKMFEYKKINQSIGSIIFYYIGLAENAIAIMRRYKVDDKQILFIQRERVYYPNYELNYYDQSNMLIDYKSRDLAEFYKSKILKTSLDVNEVYDKLNFYRFNEVEMAYFLSRIIYPTYFFDNLEKRNIEIINHIINKRIEMENFIGQIMDYIARHYNSINLYWIKKRVNYNSTLITPLQSGTSSFIAS